jgi:hypothetical protein
MSTFKTALILYIKLENQNKTKFSPLNENVESCRLREPLLVGGLLWNSALLGIIGFSDMTGLLLKTAVVIFTTGPS